HRRLRCRAGRARGANPGDPQCPHQKKPAASKLLHKIGPIRHDREIFRPMGPKAKVGPRGKMNSPNMIVIEPKRGLIKLDWRSLWEYRELIYFMVWRDVKARYKQAALGIAWAILQPLLTMVIFTVIFSHVAQVPSHGISYPIFAFAALVPW